MPARLGPYQLVTRIGLGGMAEVFLARKEETGERAAVKRILPHLSGRADFMAMFLEEARLQARLEHPHIVRIFDFGLDGADYWLAMEYVDGADLQAILRRGRSRREPLPAEDAAALLVRACEALDHAHEDGIIHRDVTPSNLLVSAEGTVKLADFGVARAGAAAPASTSGRWKGKLAYLSPEQLAGRTVDRRSDLWSLGVCAWELLTFRRLFAGRDADALAAEVKSAAPPSPRAVVPELPRALEAIVLRALARDPDARWPTARALGEALSEWLGAPRGPEPLGRYVTRLFGHELARLDEPVEPTAPLRGMMGHRRP